MREQIYMKFLELHTDGQKVSSKFSEKIYTLKIQLQLRQSHCCMDMKKS